jgi:hypothetical protein
MSSPLLVYLDSSDFSKFADPGVRTPELAEIERDLLARKAEGKIALCYSESHVIEAAALRKDDIPKASGRYAKIRDLCGTACLAHFLDIVEDEIRYARRGERLPRAATWRSDGFWFPRELDDTLFQSSAAPLKLLSQFGREERRKRLRNGKLTPFAQHEFGRRMKDFLSKSPGEIPLGRQTMHVLSQYFEGLLSAEKAERDIRALLGDVREFGRWYETDADSAMQFSSYLRTFGREFKGLLAQCREDYMKTLEAALASGGSRAELHCVVAESFAKTLRETSSKFARNLSANLGLGRGAFDVDDTRQWLPALSCATALALELARRAVFDAQPRKGGESDVGDVLHVAYLPYVDIYRTDGSMANVIREGKLAGSTEVVAKLEHLPEVIDRQLQTRAANAA